MIRVSIRSGLMAMLLLVIVLLSAALLAASMLGSRTALRTVSSTLIRQTIDQVEGRLRSFFEPVVQGLEMAKAWGDEGLLELGDRERLHRLLLPLLRGFPQVSAVLVADGNGDEHMLQRAEDGGWRTRRLEPGRAPGTARWWTWKDEPSSAVFTEQPNAYSPLQRPWYLGAIAQRDRVRAGGGAKAGRDLLHWTRPYPFYTSGEPGITAAVTFDPGDGRDHVIAFDVLLMELSRFTREQRVQRDGRVIILDGNQHVLGVPSDPRFRSDEDVRAALLKTPEQLGIPLATAAAAAFRDRPADSWDALPFEVNGEAWWGAARVYALAKDLPLLIAVVVPETDLLGEIPQTRLRILVVTLGMMALAVLLAFAFARRFSEPVEALVRESDRISLGRLDPGEPVRTSIHELQRLARAHDRMRTSLRTLLRLESDLQVARHIQQSTLPERLPVVPGFEIAAWSEPAEEAGGDTYDVIGYRRDPATQQLVVTDGEADGAVLLLADATGHGIGPALTVAEVRSMLRMAVRMGGEPTEILRHMNEQLCVDLPDDRFITAWLGTIRAASFELRSYSSGQAPIIFFEAARDDFRLLGADTMPFGLACDLPIPPGVTLAMQPGDILAVLSDGFFEAPDRRRERFGRDRVLEVIRRQHRAPAARILDALRDAVDEFRDGAAPDDDCTAIVVKRR